MQNKSTIKYLEQLLDSDSKVSLTSIDGTPIVMFDSNRYIKQVIENILLDNGIKVVKKVVKVAYMVTQKSLMVDYLSDGDHQEFAMYEFPLGHNESTSHRAYMRMVEMTKNGFIAA